MFKGSFVALITPMHADGRVDYAALGALIEWHIAEGTDGFVIVGTTGESATLTVAEHTEVIKFAISTIKGRAPVIAGTGANATEEAVALTEHAKTLGADAALLVVPYYNKPPQEGLYQHFAHIAARVALPQILYNVPGRTACDLEAETVLRLARLDNIIGIKEATGSIARLTDIKANVADDFVLFSGDDATGLAFMEAGGHGAISVTANIAPRLNREMYAHALASEWAKARTINDQLMPLHKALFCEANPIPVKWALAHMGRCTNTLRLPLVPLGSAHEATVKQALNAIA